MAIFIAHLLPNINQERIILKQTRANCKWLLDNKCWVNTILGSQFIIW